MPFDISTKTAMFIRCNRFCCLCLKQCGLNIEAAHIEDEASGGSNAEENGIPLCFDCHQEIGSYNDKHPRGNKIRPDELRARRDRVYRLVTDARIEILQPGSPSQLLKRRLRLEARKPFIDNPTMAQLVVAVDRMDHSDGDNLVLIDSAWDNAYVQACTGDNGHFWSEYRDGATQLHYRTKRQITAETLKFILLSYLYHGDSLMRCAVEWNDVTGQV